MEVDGGAAPAKEVYTIEDTKYPIPSPPPAGDYSKHQHDSIIIDNGATTLRAGWSSESSPRIVIDNVGSKYRERKTNKLIILAGSESYADYTSRGSLRSAFEGGIVSNFDQMEAMFDYIFYKLGINTDTVNHPIIMTEPFGNPFFSRSQMTELLFQAYSVPSIVYGVDSLFSLSFNSPTPQAIDALVISSATASTQIIPVLGSNAVLSNSKRLNWGGTQAGDFMLRLMQLKYPTFPGRLSKDQAISICQTHTYHSPDYSLSLRTLSDARNLAQESRVIQFPFVPLVSDEKTEEELERQAEKRKEATRRLVEQAQKQRLEKMVRQEEELISFTELKNSKGVGKKVDYEKRLKQAGFSSTEDLEAYLKKIETSLQRARNKELGVEEVEEKEPQTFPLVNVPDHTLNEEDLKEKRRQRLMKAGYDARIRAKLERDQEKERIKEEKRIDEELREGDPQGWLKKIRGEHLEIMEKMKERRKRKEQLSDRKSLAAQNRMKSIANLASEAKGGKNKRKRAEKDDDFGKNDADWAVYREIGNADDSDEEEDEQSKLQSIESRLLEHDPTFTVHETASRLALRKHQLLNAFIRGLSPDDPPDMYNPESLEHNSQLHVNVERIRVPEVIWRPHLYGIDQAGLGEIIEHVLKAFTQEERDRLTKNVFIHGGNTLVPGFDERLRSCIQPILPVGSPLNFARPGDMALDAWRGMAKWSQTDECKQARVTRAMYDELGGEYLKGHGLGNGGA